MAENLVNIIFTKSARLSGRDPSEGVKITFNLHFLTWTQVLRKNQRGLLNRKTARMFYIWFWVHWLAEQAQKSVQYQFTKLGRMTATYFKEGVKIIWKFVFLSRKQVIRKKQTIVWKEENKPKCLMCNFGCTGWHGTPQNLFNINLPNLVGWLQQTLRKEQKLF